jgi:hypothetical protein
LSFCFYFLCYLDCSNLQTADFSVSMHQDASVALLLSPLTIPLRLVEPSVLVTRESR